MELSARVNISVQVPLQSREGTFRLNEPLNLAIQDDFAGFFARLPSKPTEDSGKAQTQKAVAVTRRPTPPPNQPRLRGRPGRDHPHRTDRPKGLPVLPGSTCKRILTL